MASYSPFTPLPMDLFALRTKILHNIGLHVNFPYGIRYPRPGAGPNEYFHNEVPKSVYLGLTVRGFFYAPVSSKTRSGLGVYREELRKEYMCQALIEGADLKFQYAGPNEIDGKTKSTKIKINIPGFYSVGVRVKNQDELSLLYGEEEIGTVYEEYITPEIYDWRFRIFGGVHYLLSLHLSNEYPYDPKTPLPHQGQSYSLHNMAFGVGSSWVMKCIYVGHADYPDIVGVYMLTLGTEQIRGSPIEHKHVDFPAKNFKINDYFTVYIRNTERGYQVSTSFDGQTQMIDTTSSPLKNRMRPFVTPNAEVVKQYAEPGAERY